MASPSKQLWDYRSALSTFCDAIEDIKGAFEKLDLSKVNNQDALAGFQFYLHSGSAEIIANGKRISAVCANSNTSAYLTGEELLVKLMNAATEYLRRKPLDANDESKFRTMDLSFSLSISLVEGDVDTSRKEVEKHFSSIGKAHDVIFEIINNTPPVVLHGASSVALNNLESAFAKNMENPFWLVKSAEEPFPDLITLSWPSLDRSQDPVTAIMKRCSKKWVEKEEVLDVLTEKTLKAVKNSFRRAEAAIAAIQIEGEDAQGPISKVMKQVADTIELLSKMTVKLPRVALIGCMSHGKSSFINSLIGQQLVISEAQASTSIPMTIRHVEDTQFPPTLHITPDLFGEYIQTLRDLNEDPESELRIESELRNNLLLERQHSNLALFKGNWSFRTEYVGEKAIIEVQHQIIDLIRLCALLAPDSTPKPIGKAWPALSVHMCEMAQLKKPYFELVDLPGFGDPMGRDPAFLEQIYHDVFLDVDGVILVAALLDDQTTVQSLDVLECGRSSLANTQAPILLAIGTKRDLQRKGNWSAQSEKNTCYRIFHDIKSDRLTKTSPAIYIEGVYANQYLSSAPKDFMKKITLAELEDQQLYTYRMFERIYNFAGPATDPEIDQATFERLELSEIHRGLQRMIDSAGYKAVRDKLDKFVIDGVKKRRYLSQLVELLKCIEQVEEAEAVALRTSYGRKTVHNAIEQQRREFSTKTKTICNEWKRDKTRSKDKEALAIMQKALPGASDKASAQLEVIVRKTFAAYVMRNSGSKFEDRDKAVDFLLEVERLLRAALNKIQSDTVKVMRIDAKAAWSKSLEDLRTRVNTALIDNDQTIFKQLMLDLDRDLAELSSDSIAVQVQKKIAEELTSKTPSLSQSHAKEKAQGLMHGMGALRTMERLYAKAAEKWMGQKGERDSPMFTNVDTFMSNEGRGLAPRQNAIEPPLSVTNSTPEQELGNRSINELGFLVRASASGSAVHSPFTQEIWPWIKTEPGIEVEVDAARVVEQYKTRVLRHWKDVLERECKSSIQGAITLSIERGEKCVESFISKKTEDFSEMQESSKRPFSEEVLEMLVLFRANAIGTGEITQILGEKLYSHVASADRAAPICLPKIFKS